MTKLNINIHDAKTNLSGYLRKVEKGQIVNLCRNGKPIAQIIPFPKKKSTWDMRGLVKDKIKNIPSDFDAALTAKELPGFGL